MEALVFRNIAIILLFAGSIYGAWNTPYLFDDSRLNDTFDSLSQQLGKTKSEIKKANSSLSDELRRLIYGDLQCNSITAESFIAIVAGLRITRDSSGNAVFDVTGDYAIFKDTIKIQDATAIVFNPINVIDGTNIYYSTISAESNTLVYDTPSSGGHVFKGNATFKNNVTGEGDLSVFGNATVYDSMTVTGDLYLSSDTYWGSFVLINDTGTIRTTGNIYGANANYTEGVMDLPEITDNLDGTATIGSAHCLIRATTDFSGGRLMVFEVPETAVTLTQDSINFVYVNYNTGSPVYAVTTNRDTINNSNTLPVFRMWAEDNIVDYYMDYGQISLGNSSKNFDRVMRIRGENGIEYEGGLTLSYAGGAARIITVSAGYVWFGLKRLLLDAFESNTDTMYYHLTNESGEWYKVLVTTYNNAYYDTRAGTAELTTNRYAVNWVYRNIYSTEVDIVLGEDDYTEAQAIAEAEPSKPTHFEWFYYLVGKLIVQKGATTPTVYQNVTDTAFGGSVPTDHGGLTGLADDDHPQYAFTDGTRDITGNQTFESSVTVLGNFGVVGEITRPMTWVSSTTFEGVHLSKSNIYMADDTGIGLNDTSGRILFDDQTQDEVIIKGARFSVNNDTPESIMSYTAGAMGSYFYMNMVPGSYNAVGFIPYKNSGSYGNFAFTNSAGSFLTDSSTGDFILANYDSGNSIQSEFLFGTGSGPTTVMKVLGKSAGVEIVGTKYLGVGGNIVSSNTAGVNKFYTQTDIIGVKNLGVGGNVVSSGTAGSNRFAGEVNAEKNVGVGGVLISSGAGVNSVAGNLSVTGMLSGGNIISSGTLLVTNGLVSMTSNTLLGRTLIDAATTFMIGTASLGDTVIGIGCPTSGFENINSRLVLQVASGGGGITVQAPGDAGDDGFTLFNSGYQLNNAETGAGYKSATLGLGTGIEPAQFDLWNISDPSNPRVHIVSTGTSYVKNYWLFLSSAGVDQNNKFYVSTVASSGSNLYIQSPINFEGDTIRLIPQGIEYTKISTITFVSENLVIDPYDDLIIKGTNLYNYGNLETETNLSAGGVIHSSGSGTNLLAGALDVNGAVNTASMTVTELLATNRIDAPNINAIDHIQSSGTLSVTGVGTFGNAVNITGAIDGNSSLTIGTITATGGTNQRTANLISASTAQLRLSYNDTNFIEQFATSDGRYQLTCTKDSAWAGLGKIQSAGYDWNVFMGDANANTGSFIINQCRGKITAAAAVQSGDRLGQLLFKGYDGSNFSDGAYIRAFADVATWGTNDRPSRMEFYTTPDGSGTGLERIEINNQGDVAVMQELSVGGVLYTSNTVTINATGTSAQLTINRTSSGGMRLGADGDGLYVWDPYAATTRLTVSTNVGVNDSTPDATLEVVSNASPTGYSLLVSSQDDTTALLSVNGGGALDCRNTFLVITSTSDQTVANGVATISSFNFVDNGTTDYNNEFSTAANTFTAKYAGKYFISAEISAATIDTQWQIYIYKNENPFNRHYGTANSAFISEGMYLAAGDRIAIYVYQNDTGAGYETIYGKAAGTHNTLTIMRIP